jgi:hypothetical protein
LEEKIIKSLYLIGGDLEEIKLEGSENFGSIFEVFIIFGIWLFDRNLL